MCSSRDRQSPINFDLEMMAQPPTTKLIYKYQQVRSSFEVNNDGKTLAADFAGLGYGGVTYEGSWYNLFNANIHAESEHTFNGVHAPVEIHLVHKKYDDDKMLVIALPVGTALSVAGVPAPAPGPAAAAPGPAAAAPAPAPAPAAAASSLVQSSSSSNSSAGSTGGRRLPGTTLGEDGRPLGRNGLPETIPEGIARVKYLAAQAHFAIGEAAKVGALPGAAGASVPAGAAGPAPAAPSAAPGAALPPAPAIPTEPPALPEDPYHPPDLKDPNFNKQIQFFLKEEPPPVNMKVTATVDQFVPLDLNELVKDATYFEYTGSQTAPPCAELVTWFVRREPILASDAQVSVLKNAIYQLSADFGNYRKAMPLNGRVVAVATAEEEAPPGQAPTQVVADSNFVNPTSTRVGRAMKWAKKALKISKTATDYLKNLDERAQAAAQAHVAALAPDIQATPPPPPVVAGPPPNPVEMAKTASQMATMIAAAAKDAVNEAARDIASEAQNSAMAAANEAAAAGASVRWINQPPAGADGPAAAPAAGPAAGPGGAPGAPPGAAPPGPAPAPAAA